MPVKNNKDDIIKGLQAKVRKLQKENRALRQQLTNDISRHMPDVNEEISTDVDTQEESTTEVNPNKDVA